MYRSNIAFYCNSMEINIKNNKLDETNLHFNKLINLIFKRGIPFVGFILFGLFHEFNALL